MSITTIDKEHLNKLIEVPNLEMLQNDKIVKAIQRNSNNYAKIKILMNQLAYLKTEFESVIRDSIESEELETVSCNFKKKPGHTYYLYQNAENGLFFSILSPTEWNTPNQFVASYFYDYDHVFQKMEQ